MVEIRSRVSQLGKMVVVVHATNPITPVKTVTKTELVTIVVVLGMLNGSVNKRKFAKFVGKQDIWPTVVLLDVDCVMMAIEQ